MGYEGYKSLRFENKNRVLWVTMHGQTSMNPVDKNLHADLARVFIDLQRDRDSDIVVLTGAGKGFCAGGDMNWFRETTENPSLFRDDVPEAKRMLYSMLELEKPIVCRLNGAAVGLGASLALACDIIIADENARIGDPHVKAGLVAADGGAMLWPQSIGFARAKEYLLTGDLLTAREAAAIGLINHAVPTAELDAKVNEIVAKIQANPKWAVRWTKASINLALRDVATRVCEPAFAYEILTNMTADRCEAVASFLEKRPPQFTGE